MLNSFFSNYFFALSVNSQLKYIASELLYVFFFFKEMNKIKVV